MANFKARIINEFIAVNDIHAVIEWGVGDGNQLSLLRVPSYIGFDVSSRAIDLCNRKFVGDNSKMFVVFRGEEVQVKRKADLSMSLDVIYHLVEDSTFEAHMWNVFNSSDRFVCIYSSDFDGRHAVHVRNRKFSAYIARAFPDWRLLSIVENEYPYDMKDPGHTSWSNFHFYQRTCNRDDE